MKSLINFIILLLASQIMIAIPLSEAVQKNIVSATFESNGIHRGQSIVLTVDNISNQNIQIDIPNGTYLDHEEEGYQDHIIVENYNIALKPAENKKIQIVALCTQSSNSCPQLGSKFTIKPYDNKKVLDLCKLIMETKEFEYTGQYALWEMLNNGDPNNIEGENIEHVNKLRSLVAQSLSKPTLPYVAGDYDRPLQRSGYNLSLWVEGNYYLKNITGGQKVEYGIFDQEGNPISEIKKDVTQENFWKKHNVEFRFDVAGLNIETKYFLQIKVDGVIRKEWLYRYQG